VLAPKELSYKNVFRLIIMQFMDAYNFDVRSVKRACVHIVHPDGRLIPFDTFNLFYRDDKEAYLKKLQTEYAPKQIVESEELK
ncbi:MAG: radical SAM protein, partial [Candidatus Thermochlorobacter sp.]